MCNNIVTDIIRAVNSYNNEYMMYLPGEAFNEVWLNDVRLNDVHSDQPTSITTAATSFAAKAVQSTLVGTRC